MNAITHIESEVPFGHSLYASLYTQGLQLKDIRHQGNLESRYLAWETVRKQQNPFFLKGTGFEGYLVGKCPDSQAALEAILNINQNILTIENEKTEVKDKIRSSVVMIGVIIVQWVNGLEVSWYSEDATFLKP